MLWNKEKVSYENGNFYVKGYEEIGCFGDFISPEIIYNEISDEYDTNN